MYSDDIERLLSAGKIKTGDGVSVTFDGQIIEGVLMPRPDVGDSGILVVKRKDGYNMGIRYGKGFSVKKTGERREHFSFPKRSAPKGAGLPRISMIYTGGTIGSKVDYASGGVYMLTKPEELLHDVPELEGIASIDIHDLMSIASEDMTHAEWAKIADETAKALNGGAKGVVITHGTDTMHYTSAALSFMLKGLNAPVVLTGAQRSSDRGSSDAFVNLICSAQIASKSDVAEVGICMHNTSSDKENVFIRGTKARKMHTSARDAFKPINSLPICRADASGTIEYIGEYRHAEAGSKKKVSAETKFEEKVAIVKTHPNSDPGVIEYYTGKGFKGLIIEGTGLGHVPTTTSKKGMSWIEGIKRAIDEGVVVGITSQCINGRVNENVYRNLRTLRGAGAIFCEDMMSEVAYVKLGWLLGSMGKAEAAGLLNKNIAGEISERRDADWFTE
ncbi:MAG: Glu-tRNA(Gln) amidotransferase subunit GatD [Candidatus Micrarchaeota archaeon]|nr:Glu-tRNA(Gln) amidotransferase subunit GatD [Candidatus Micrarchaeota archaeon]